MDDSPNSSHLQTPPLQNSNFPDDLNASQQLKASKTSSLDSYKLKDSTDKQASPLVLQLTQNQTKTVEQSLLEDVQENEFIPTFAQNKKNAKKFTFNSQPQFLDQFQTQEEYVSGHAEGTANQPQHQTSFLLDSDTYKEICIEEHSKRAEFCSHFDVKSMAAILDLCSIHEKPFEIVCIEDKTLVCSHCAIFGQHKTHSLAPLNQIEKEMANKKSHINHIMTEYKALQLNIKQKDFSSQFVQKIAFRKNQIKSKVEEQFMKIYEFLNTYQQQIHAELDQLYEALESKLFESIKRTCIDSNTQAFERWQKDALKIIQQVTCEQVPMIGRVNLFLNNFRLPEFDHSKQVDQTFHEVSLEVEGEKYYQQIKEELNLSITQIMKTVDFLNVNLTESFEQTLKSLITFQCESKLNEILEQKKLTLIEERTISISSFDSIKESMKHLHPSSLRSTISKLPQTELASTVVSMSQGTPIHLHPMLNGSIKFNSPSKKNLRQKQTEQKVLPQAETIKKSLKYKRYQTLQDMKKFEQNIKKSKSPANMYDAKSDCGQKKRRISPCLKDMVGADNQKLFMSSMRPRIERLTSKENSRHRRTPSGEIKIAHNVQFRQVESRKIQLKDEDPLKILEHYEKSETEALELSELNLNDTEIVYFVQKASKIRKIKQLKLASNLLTSQGFEKLIPYLSHCSLINLSNNKLNELVVEYILRKKEKLGQLRMVNLANNKLNERKIKEKMEQFKKMNIVVTL